QSDTCPADTWQHGGEGVPGAKQPSKRKQYTEQRRKGHRPNSLVNRWELFPSSLTVLSNSALSRASSTSVSKLEQLFGLPAVCQGCERQMRRAKNKVAAETPGRTHVEAFRYEGIGANDANSVSSVATEELRYDDVSNISSATPAATRKASRKAKKGGGGAVCAAAKASEAASTDGAVDTDGANKGSRFIPAATASAATASEASRGAKRKRSTGIPRLHDAAATGLAAALAPAVKRTPDNTDADDEPNSERQGLPAAEEAPAAMSPPAKKAAAAKVTVAEPGGKSAAHSAHVAARSSLTDRGVSKRPRGGSSERSSKVPRVEGTVDKTVATSAAAAAPAAEPPVAAATRQPPAPRAPGEAAAATAGTAKTAAPAGAAAAKPQHNTGPAASACAAGGGGRGSDRQARLPSGPPAAYPNDARFALQGQPPTLAALIAQVAKAEADAVTQRCGDDPRRAPAVRAVAAAADNLVAAATAAAAAEQKRGGGAGSNSGGGAAAATAAAPGSMDGIMVGGIRWEEAQEQLEHLRGLRDLFRQEEMEWKQQQQQQGPAASTAALPSSVAAAPTAGAAVSGGAGVVHPIAAMSPSPLPPPL
ncbi:unnamed protein product, partial [Phaeothamnion confervicola]